MIKVFLFIIFVLNAHSSVPWNSFFFPRIEYDVKLVSSIDNFITDRENKSLYFLKNGNLWKLSFDDFSRKKVIRLYQIDKAKSLTSYCNNKVYFEDIYDQIWRLDLKTNALHKISFSNFWKENLKPVGSVRISNISKHLSKNIFKKLQNLNNLENYGIGFEGRITKKLDLFFNKSKLTDLFFYSKEKKFICKYFYKGLDNKITHGIHHLDMRSNEISFFTEPHLRNIDFGFVPFIVKSYNKTKLRYIVATRDMIYSSHPYRSPDKAFFSNKRDISNTTTSVLLNASLKVFDYKEKPQFFVQRDKDLYWTNLGFGYLNAASRDENNILDIRKKNSIHPFATIGRTINFNSKSLDHIRSTIKNKFVLPTFFCDSTLRILLQRYQFEHLDIYENIDKKIKLFYTPKSLKKVMKSFYGKDNTEVIRILEIEIPKLQKSKFRPKGILLLEWIQVAVFDALGEYDRVAKFAIHMQKRLKPNWERDIHMLDTVRYFIKKGQLKWAKHFISKFYTKNSYRAMLFNCLGLISATDEKWLDAKKFLTRAQKLKSDINLLVDLDLINQKIKTSPKVSQKKAQTKSCISCQSKLSINAKFCANCGTKVKLTTCPSCKSKIKANDKFCASCGTKI
ncbi:zinc ribbon domain-containing protein [bacterium]|nr:zinc ribbon domain-containing protein [bacterium]